MPTSSGLLALALLLPLGSPGAVPSITPDEGSRVASIPTSADFGEPSAGAQARVPGLLERIRKPVSTQDRALAIEELVEMGRDALPMLVAEIETRHRRTWPVMIYALGATRDPRVLPILAEHIKTQTGKSYLEVLYAMSLAGDERALLRALRSTDATTPIEEGATAVDMIAGARGASVVPTLIEEIPRRAATSRAAAIGALGTIGDVRAVEFLLGWSKQENPTDRRYALAALARIGDPRAIPRLLEALSDADELVRSTAAEGLGYLRAEPGVPALISWLEGAEYTHKHAQAVWSLGLIGGETATRALVALYQREGAPDSLKSHVLTALGRAAHKEGLPAIALGLRSPEPHLTDLAARAAVKVEPASDARDLLLAACESAPSTDAGLLAARDLVQLRDPRATPCIVRRLRESLAEFGSVGPTAEELLRELALTGSTSAAESLERLAGEQSAPAVAHRLKSAAQSVRFVQELGNDVDPWLQLLDDGTPTDVDLAIRKLGDLRDPRAVEPLTRAFGRSDPDRAHDIPRALGLIGSDRATPFLISLLVDDLYYRVPSLARTREEAAIALARYAHTDHAASALITAFELTDGKSVVPLLAYAHILGKDAIPELLRAKTLLLQRRGEGRVAMHERVNWAIRMLRLGRTIEIDEIRDRE